MAVETEPRTCIYCGRKVGRVKNGEHIIPKAIGGGPTSPAPGKASAL